METPLRAGIRRAVSACHSSSRRLPIRSRRCLATTTETGSDFRAAPPIRFTNDANQFAQPRAEFVDDAPAPYQRGRVRPESKDGEVDYTELLRRVRIVPASPSYFTATPKYTDDFLHLSTLVRRYQLLPVLPPSQHPRVAWKPLLQYKTEIAEPIRQKPFSMLLLLLKRLNSIHPSLMPDEVKEALEKFKRDVQPHLNQPKPIMINEYGVAKGVGRRKSSSAVVCLVEGEGEVLINGRKLTEYFGRLHDRESAVWPLKVTGRLDKYNVWALAKGGGTTGQAEAITLGLAKALMAHEPDLKPALRQGELSTPNDLLLV
jgi:small subunit ribosomal protein S9